MLIGAATFVAVLLSLVAFLWFPAAYAEPDGAAITLRSSFVDSEGRVNVVGTVRNFGQSPVQVVVGVQTTTGQAIQGETFGRTIWPLSEAPFKIRLDEGQQQAGDPYIISTHMLNIARFDTLVLMYESMAVGQERAFVGKIQNIGPFDMRNVSVYAGVHDRNHTSQLDSVRSNVIPVIHPGEEADFVAVPDQVVRDGVGYYSCAGLDYDDPITTVKVGDGEILAYDLTAAAQVRNFRYDNSTDSLAFGIRPYSSGGGDLAIKLPQLSSNQTVSVLLDGNSHEASVSGDGRTLAVDFFVPSGDHEVQIQGVRNIPELPGALFVLAGVMAGLASIRFAKAAFKMT